MERKLDEERAALLKEDFSRGFIRNCGIRLTELEWGRAVSTLEVTAQHSQQDGFVHAGVMAAMADHTAGYAAFSVVPEDQRILSVEFKINFLRPASGSAVICRARVVKEGRQVIVADSEVYDLKGGEERLAAKALVTLMAVPVEKLQPAAGSRHSG